MLRLAVPLVALLLRPPVALANEPTLPVLERAVRAAYPPEALAAGLEADVLLQLDVDEDGRVTEVVFVEPAGNGFDEAAAQAAQAYRFAPARDATGQPAPARILYRVRFEADRAPIPSVEAQVLDATTRMPVPGLRAVLRGPDDAVWEAETDADGALRFADLAPGAWTVEAEGIGWEAVEAAFTVEEGKVAALVLYAPRVAAPQEDLGEVVEVFATRRPAPEITERVLSAEEVYFLPGTNGDVVRAIQNLPGVARPPLNIGQLVIRGTRPEDSAYYIDGAKVPLVFHFAGLSTVVNGEALQEVAFLPGNYGVRYGRTLGGAVDLRFDPALPEASSGFVSLDLFQATAFVEQRLSDRAAIQISARRSYADAVLTPLLSNADVQFRAPAYWDASARFLYDGGRAGTFDTFVVFSDDQFRVVGGMAEEDADQVQISLATRFLQGRTRWNRALPGGWQNDLILALGPDTNAFQIAPNGDAYERAFRIGVREEVYKPIRDGEWWGMRAGLDLAVVSERFLYDVAAFGEAERGDAWWASPSPYVEPSFRAGPVTLTPGVRLDPLLVANGFTTFSVDPRLSARVQATPTTELKASFGRYAQLPTLRQIVAEGGEGAPLGPESSWQTSAGLTQQLRPWLAVEVVGFYNVLTDLIVGREDTFRFFSGPPPIGPFDTDPYANDGTGRVYGIEAQARVTHERVTALIAFTSSRSERVNRPGDDKRLFTYDQPFVLNALGSVDVGRGWRTGARIRYGSGNPYTPVVNRIYALDDRAFVPVYGKNDSARLPSFFSLDLRVDKAWQLRGWRLVTYLDVQNATSRQNVEVMAWTWDFAKEDPIAGLPILPTFGLRAEW